MYFTGTLAKDDVITFKTDNSNYVSVILTAADGTALVLPVGAVILAQVLHELKRAG